MQITWSKAWTNLRILLQSREKSENKQWLAEIGIPFENYLPRQKNTTAIYPEKVDWEQLNRLELSREQLEQSGELEKMLNWQKTISLRLPSRWVPPPSIPTRDLPSARTVRVMSDWRTSL